MTISGGSALSKDDIDRMVRDAEQYAEEDAKRRETIEARNQADSLVYSTEKFVTENDDKLSDELKAEVQADIDQLKKLLEAEDTDKDAFNAAITKLGESSQKMGAALYAASAEEAGEAGAAGEEAAAGDEDVVDAEIVDEPEAKDDGN